MYSWFARFGPRFPPVSRAYDLEIRKLAKSLAIEMGFKDFIQEGVYSMMVGPNFETVTECRFLEIVGVDATGKFGFIFYMGRVGHFFNAIKGQLN